jgi:hypothetical protein
MAGYELLQPLLGPTPLMHTLHSFGDLVLSSITTIFHLRRGHCLSICMSLSEGSL